MNFLKALQCLKGQRLHVSHHFLTAVEIVYSSKVSSNLIQSHLLNIWAAEKEKKIRKKKKKNDCPSFSSVDSRRHAEVVTSVCEKVSLSVGVCGEAGALVVLNMTHNPRWLMWCIEVTLRFSIHPDFHADTGGVQCWRRWSFLFLFHFFFWGGGWKFLNRALRRAYLWKAWYE